MCKQYIVAIDQKYYPSIINAPNAEIAMTLFKNLECKGEIGKVYLCEVINMKEVG